MLTEGILAVRKVLGNHVSRIEGLSEVSLLLSEIEKQGSTGALRERLDALVYDLQFWAELAVDAREAFVLDTVKEQLVGLGHVVSVSTFLTDEKAPKTESQKQAYFKRLRDPILVVCDAVSARTQINLLPRNMNVKSDPSVQEVITQLSIRQNVLKAKQADYKERGMGAKVAHDCVVDMIESFQHIISNDAIGVEEKQQLDAAIKEVRKLLEKEVGEGNLGSEVTAAFNALTSEVRVVGRENGGGRHEEKKGGGVAAVAAIASKEEERGKWASKVTNEAHGGVKAKKKKKPGRSEQDKGVEEYMYNYHASCIAVLENDPSYQDFVRYVKNEAHLKEALRVRCNARVKEEGSERFKAVKSLDVLAREEVREFYEEHRVKTGLEDKVKIHLKLFNRHYNHGFGCQESYLIDLALKFVLAGAIRKIEFEKNGDHFRKYCQFSSGYDDKDYMSLPHEQGIVVMKSLPYLNFYLNKGGYFLSNKDLKVEYGYKLDPKTGEYKSYRTSKFDSFFKSSDLKPYEDLRNLMDIIFPIFTKFIERGAFSYAPVDKKAAEKFEKQFRNIGFFAGATIKRAFVSGLSDLPSISELIGITIEKYEEIFSRYGHLSSLDYVFDPDCIERIGDCYRASLGALLLRQEFREVFDHCLTKKHANNATFSFLSEEEKSTFARWVVEQHIPITEVEPQPEASKVKAKERKKQLVDRAEGDLAQLEECVKQARVQVGSERVPTLEWLKALVTLNKHPKGPALLTKEGGIKLPNEKVFVVSEEGLSKSQQIYSDTMQAHLQDVDVIGFVIKAGQRNKKQVIAELFAPHHISAFSASYYFDCTANATIEDWEKRIVEVAKADAETLKTTLRGAGHNSVTATALREHFGITVKVGAALELQPLPSKGPIKLVPQAIAARESVDRC